MNIKVGFFILNICRLAPGLYIDSSFLAGIDGDIASLYLPKLTGACSDYPWRCCDEK